MIIRKVIVVSVNFQKLKVGLKTRIVSVLHVKELNVFWFHFVFDSILYLIQLELQYVFVQDF
ncbi:hypothetical protein Bca4012_043840 [Brassica carinata]|uniref:(rape) hypothetical protein n=1 Tax=Brassica napus TaxID=3708 RepID=A0A816J008_BRANA|nr:unnamed protein product [Brassica napus]